MDDKERADQIWNVGWRLVWKFVKVVVVVYLLAALLLAFLAIGPHIWPIDKNPTAEEQTNP